MAKIIFILLIVTITFTTKAQEAFVPETTIGLKGGTNHSRFSFRPSISQNVMLGYAGGVVFKHISQPKLGIQVELNYVQRGWTEKGYTRRLNYIELPFMTHVALGAKSTKFILNFGPNASYLISGKKSTEAANEEDSSSYYHRNVDNPFMVGLILGVGLMQNTSLGAFLLEGRVTQSLSNIFSNGSALLVSKNQSIGLTISYLLEFRKVKQEQGKE